MSEWTPRLEQARQALRAESWADAYEHLSALAPAHLGPEELEGLADAAWWLSRISDSLRARQRAYSAWAAAGEHERAAFAAWRLATEHAMRGDGAVGTGWLKRAERHLQSEPECVVHGYLALSDAEVAHVRGQVGEAMAQARRAAKIASSFDDRDLLALAIETQGRLLIARGRVAEGSALLDEAMTSVIAGELSSYVTGWIYCQVIYACLELADLGRAGEWNDAAMAWCESIPSAGFAGSMCGLNRAEVVSLRGELAVAEAEARRASAQFMAMGEQPMAGEAFYATGDYRRRMGDLDGAQEAFTRADELGRDPQPGLALVWLAQGKVDAALASLRLSLDTNPTNRLRRARILAALVEATVAAGELDGARAACRELDSIAEEFESPALAAMAAMARGAVRLAEDDGLRALHDLRQAWAVWQELKMPYEVARARMMIGLARRSAGDDEGGRRDLEAARTAFQGLGAAADVRRAMELLGQRHPLPSGLTEREAEVLRLVAAGWSNRQVAERLFISEHTVARHLQNIFAKLGVSSRSAATAFAFEHHLV